MYYLKHYLKACTFVYNNVQYQRKYIETFLRPWLTHRQNQYGAQLQPTVQKKIYQYYSILVPGILCETYTHLYGYKLTEEERQRATLMGVLTPLYDDFFDDQSLSPQQVKALTNYPQTYPAHTIEENIFRDIQTELLASVKNKARYLATFHRVYQSQTNSLLQLNPAITQSDIWRITTQKGADALLLYQDLLNIPPTEAVSRIIAQGSGLLQLANDVFDIYKDVHAGIHTLPTHTKNFRQLNTFYRSEIQSFNQAVRTLPYTTDRKERFILVFNTINGRAMVALRQLIRLQQTTDLSNLAAVKREQLICDMQKKNNIARWLWETYAICRPRK